MNRRHCSRRSFLTTSTALVVAEHGSREAIRPLDTQRRAEKLELSAPRCTRTPRAAPVPLVRGVAPLIIAGRFTNNPLEFGFLFAFLTPVGGLLIVSGTVFALAAKQSPDRQES